MRWLRRVRIEESRRLIRMTLNGRVRYAKKREEELRRSGLYKSLGWE